MEEELTLPKLPAVSWDSETQTFTNTRKRARNGAPPSSAFNNSSDPAVFSSDDDPNVENYTQGRHQKRRYVGSWFQQHPASSDSTFSEAPRPLPKAKRVFRRDLDSGVWMGSDNSVDLEGDDFTEIKAPAEPKLPQLRHARPVPVISPIEQAIRDKIQNAIEDGNPTVDLSSFNLESVSNSTISQISTFDTLLNPDFPNTPRDTFTKLYLSNNPLLRAPGAIFNLEYLSVLSLRNTEITELPPSIGNLRNLETLNLSLTRLRYLPGELLELMKYPGKLRTLTIHPNPFYRPDCLLPNLIYNDDLEDTYKSDAAFYREWYASQGWFCEWLNRNDDAYHQNSDNSLDRRMFWDVHILARSPVQYNDSRGAILSKFQLPQLRSSDPDCSNLIIQTEDLSSSPALPQSARSVLGTTPKQGRVLSLFELALQACSKSGQVGELTSYLPPSAPSHFSELLDRIATRAEEHDNSGDLPCSICGRRVMVPVAQWIEWWETGYKDIIRTDDGFECEFISLGSNESERVVPFLRRGCSWECLPRPMQPGKRLPGTLKWCYVPNVPKEEDASS